ncbi:MAG: hypothetical protein QGG62_06895 [Candidatus Poseidoniaceae archaeon]|nr:hypothetical protein [Candidatus Poseidoniaceae archaeon]
MNRIQYILHNLKAFAEDTQFTITGESRPKHDGIRRMTRKIHKKLIEHDRETIAMLEHASIQAEREQIQFDAQLVQDKI